MENKVKVYYWKIRGFGTPVASLLEHLKVPYEMVYYTDGKKWLADKAQLIEDGFLTPNLPYVECDGNRLSETFAILNCLASKYKPELVASSSSEFTKILMVKGIIHDYTMGITLPVYICKTLEEANADIKAKLERHISKTNYLKSVLAKGPWLLGEKLSFLDFFWAEMVEKLVTMEEELKQGFIDADTLKVFKEYVARFAELDGVKEYRASERFIKRPFNNVPKAVWG